MATNDPTNDRRLTARQRQQLTQAINAASERQQEVESRWRTRRMLDLSRQGFIELHETDHLLPNGTVAVAVTPGPRTLARAQYRGCAPADLVATLLWSVANLTELTSPN